MLRPDPRTNLSVEVNAEVRKYLGAAVFDTIIPRSVRLSEAPSYGLPIALYRPDSKGAEAYGMLPAELRARDGRPAAVAPVPNAAIARPDHDPSAADDGGDAQ